MNVTGSPVSLVLDDRELPLYPLTDGAVNEVTLWVRSNFIRSVRMSLAGADSATEARQMRLAYRTSLEIDWLTKPGSLAVMTFDGRCKLLQVSTKPRITHQQARGILTDNGSPDTEAMQLFWDLFTLVNDLGGLFFPCQQLRRIGP